MTDLHRSNKPSPDVRVLLDALRDMTAQRDLLAEGLRELEWRVEHIDAELQTLKGRLQ